MKDIFIPKFKYNNEYWQRKKQNKIRGSPSN